MFDFLIFHFLILDPLSYIPLPHIRLAFALRGKDQSYNFKKMFASLLLLAAGVVVLGAPVKKISCDLK